MKLFIAQLDVNAFTITREIIYDSIKRQTDDHK